MHGKTVVQACFTPRKAAGRYHAHTLRRRECLAYGVRHQVCVELCASVVGTKHGVVSGIKN